MAAEFIMRLKGSSLVPASGLDEELMGVLPASKDLRVVVTVAKDTRSVEQNNLRWKVCQMIADNTEGWDKDSVNDALKVATGHVTFRQSPNGEFWRFPKPTDFGTMGSAEFTAWLDRAFAAIADLFGQGLSDAIWAELGLDTERHSEAA